MELQTIKTITEERLSHVQVKLHAMDMVIALEVHRSRVLVTPTGLAAIVVYGNARKVYPGLISRQLTTTPTIRLRYARMEGTVTQPLVNAFALSRLKVLPVNIVGFLIRYF